MVWGGRALGARRRFDDQLLFGIVQGGVDSELRAEAAERTVALCGEDPAGQERFDGFGIGGLSVGESRAEMVPAIEATTAHLPLDRPRYVMGLGDPAGMVEAVAHGVDLFDCVLPTRHGRHGTILTSAGRINLKNAEWATADEPLDPTCPCEVCARWSKGYLRHLIAVNEPTGPRLATLHNLAWTLRLVDDMRQAIVEGRFEALRRDVARRLGLSQPGVEPPGVGGGHPSTLLSRSWKPSSCSPSPSGSPGCSSSSRSSGGSRSTRPPWPASRSVTR